MGRPPKPTAEHLRLGTFRPERHATRLDTMQTDDGPPIIKPDLPPTASEFWDTAAKSLGRALRPSDAALLESCARWWARLLDLQRRLEAGGDDERETQQMAAAASRQFAALLGRLGLSPTDRAKVSTVAPGKPADPSPLKALAAMQNPKR